MTFRNNRITRYQTRSTRTERQLCRPNPSADGNPDYPRPLARGSRRAGSRRPAHRFADTVYDLFAKGELPGRKVGRKWITTKAAVLRWIENTSTDDTLARAIQGGDMDALTRAMNKGKVRRRPEG